jgi:hypothetical protein
MFDYYGVYKIATNNGYRIGVCNKMSPTDDFECLADNLEKEEAIRTCSELSAKLQIKEFDKNCDKVNVWNSIKRQMQALGAKEEEIQSILSHVSEWA